MESWGFENRTELPGDVFGLLEGGAKPTGGAGSGGTKLKFDKPLELSEAEKAVPPGTPEESPPFVLMYADPGKSPALFKAGKVFNRPGVFKNYGTVAKRIDTRNEVDALKDIDKETRDAHEKDLAGKETWVKYIGADGREHVTPLNMMNAFPVADTTSTDGITNPITGEPDTSDIKARRRAVDLLIGQLLAALAGGNFNLLSSIMNLNALNKRFDATILATAVTKAMQEHGLANEKTQEKLVAAFKSGKTDGNTRGEIEKLQMALQTNKAFEQTLTNTLRDVLGSAIGDAETAKQVIGEMRSLEMAGGWNTR